VDHNTQFLQRHIVLKISIQPVGLLDQKEWDLPLRSAEPNHFIKLFPSRSLQLLHTANTEANQNDIADFFAILLRNLIQKPINEFTEEEDALLRRLSQGLEASDKDEP
jgi:hypothetical protein